MIIHQIYYDLGYGVIDNIERFKQSHIETKKFCDENNIDYRLWSREDIEFFIKNISLEWITFYNNLRYDIQRIDFARLIIIYICGGIYMDLDITINREDKIIELFKQPILIVRWENSHLPYNALIGCKSYNKIIYQLIVYIITNYNSKEDMKIYNTWKGRFVFHTTGHYAIHKVLKKFTHVEYRDILYIESKGKKIGNKNTALFYDTNESVWYKPELMDKSKITFSKSNLKNYNIVVINLERRKDRLKSITEQLEKLNLSYTIFKAWDAKKEGLEKTEEKIKSMFGKKFYQWSKDDNLRLGRMGCTISHLAVMEEAVLNNINSLVILEDDAVILKTDFPKPDKNQRLPNIYYLGGLISKDKSTLELTNGWNKIDDFKFWGAFGYLVENIPDLVKKLKTYSPRAIDAMYVRIQKTRGLYLYPSICKHSIDLGSDVTFINKPINYGKNIEHNIDKA